MRTRHTYDLPSAPLADINPLPIEDTHITYVEVSFSTPHTLPLVASSPQPLDIMSNVEESIPTVDVDQER